MQQPRTRREAAWLGPERREASNSELREPAGPGPWSPRGHVTMKLHKRGCRCRGSDICIMPTAFSKWLWRQTPSGPRDLCPLSSPPVMWAGPWLPSS